MREIGKHGNGLMTNDIRVPVISLFRRPACAVAACVAVAMLAACDRESDQVRSYDIPKEQAPAAAANTPARPAATARVMAWDLPEGWQRKSGGGGIRFATLTAGEGESALEVSIIRLAGVAGGVGPNINRWRTQVGLDVVSDSEAAASATEIKARGTKGFLVDLTGPTDADKEWEASRMLAAIFPADDSAWFIKTTATVSTIETYESAFVALCESVRFVAPGGAKTPVAATPPSAAASDSRRDGPQWDTVPVGWALDAKPRSMAVASFTLTSESQRASLTITPLGGSQDLLGNINRWRRQVGLGPLANLDEQPPVSIDVAGTPGHLVDIAGSQSHILGVVSVRGGTTWFFKLTGPDPLVADQKAAFESFVRSIKF